MDVSKLAVKTFTARTNPADANSTTYKLNVQIMEGLEPLRSTIEWVKTVQEVFAGTNTTTDAGKIAICRGLTKGSAKAALEEGVRMDLETKRIQAAEAARDNAINGNAEAAFQTEMAKPLTDFYADDGTTVLKGLQQIVANVCPTKALQKVKRYLRRESRKPRDMKIREYVQKLNHINNEEIPFFSY